MVDKLLRTSEGTDQIYVSLFVACPSVFFHPAFIVCPCAESTECSLLLSLVSLFSPSHSVYSLKLEDALMPRMKVLDSKAKAGRLNERIKDTSSFLHPFFELRANFH